MANPDASSLSCQELIELVTDYVEGTLSPADQARFERHLDACTDCHRYLDQMRQTILLVGALAEEDIPDDAKDASSPCLPRLETAGLTAFGRFTIAEPTRRSIARAGAPSPPTMRNGRQMRS